MRTDRRRRPGPGRIRPLPDLERLERRIVLSQYALGSLILDGTFTQTGSTFSSTGPVDIGLAPTSTETFNPLTVWTGDLSFTSGSDQFTFSGTIEGIEQGSDPTIAQVGSSQAFTVASLTGSGVGVSGSPLSVLGASLTANSLSLVDPAGGDTTDSFVSLQGDLGFSELAGLDVPLSGSNFVRISPSASAPGLTLSAATTTSAFQGFGVDFSSVSLSVGYSTSTGEFQLSGSVGVATSSGDFTAAGTLGTSSLPGLLIDGSGNVTQLSVTLSSSISTYGLNINANGLTFDYQAASGDQYLIQSGTITASDSAGDFSFQGVFGSGSQPGLVVTSGSLTSLYATLNGTATASGLTLTAANDVLEFSAAGGGTPARFAIASGSVTVGSASSSVLFDGTFGAAGGAGLVLQGGSLTSLDISVTGSMTVAGLSITADGLDFTYDATTDTFGIASGSVSVTATGLSFDGVFGSGSTPGLTMSGSTLTEVDVNVTSQINLKGLTLSVNNLQFSYEYDSTSIYNGDFVIASGSVSIATTANDTVFAAEFGSGPNPGLVISNGTLSSLYATVSSTLTAQSLVFNASGLVFQYQGASDTFEIATGSVSLTSGTIQFASATFGQAGTPGLSIKNGVLTGLDVSITSSMTVSGMSLSISQVQLIYYAVANQTYGDFEIANGGSVSLTAGPADNTLSFQGTFGTSENNQTLPGLSISNGVLQSFAIAVTSDISLAGSLTLSTTGLTFSYVASSQTFEIASGSVSVVDTTGDFTFTGTFGATLSGGTTVPGLVVTNGALTELNVSVTSQLKAASLTFNVDNLDFYYNAAQNQYEIDSGSLSFKTSEGFSFSATFGLPDPSSPGTNLPGLVIENGALTEFNASLTASFTVAGLVVDVNDVSMSYGSGEYQMDGTVTVNTSSVSFTGTIGQPTAPTPVYGLIIEDGSLKSLAITINSDVTFGSLTLQAENLAFNYEASPESFTLYGTVTTSVAGVTLVGNLGTASSPGLSIVNGQLDELNLGVTTDFTLFDLQCNVQDLTFEYQSLNGDTNYILYGSLSVSISGESLSATLGTASNPGLVIQNGVVTQINMSISGSFGISGFDFDIVDAGLDYDSTSNEYLIFGTFTLTDVFSASVQLGTGSSNPGITVINGVFQLDNFAFSLDNVPIGGFTLNYVNISYASAGDVWSGSAMVTFPTGWSISASMTFVNGNLDDISLAYNAGTSPGIAIPDTGVFVTEISGSLQNLDEPASIIVSGTIQAVFGDKITIGGTTCTIFAATGSFSADSQQLTINGNYYEGAYETNGKWNGILGTGTASVDLDWSAGVYSASVSENLYDGTFVISASLTFDDSGDLAIMASASVNVPDAVPLIGGDELGSMSFAFIYTASTNSGIVAAWTTINYYIGSSTVGFQYSFSSGSSGDFSLIGSGGVSDIENDFNTIASTDASTPPVYVYSYTVTVPSGSGANGLSVQATWPSNTGTQTLLISGPNDNGTYYSVTSSSLPSNDEFLTAYTTSTSQSVMTTGSSTDTSVLLPPGTYSFEVQSTYQFPSTSNVAFTNQLYYESPSVSITSVPTSALSFVPSMSGFAAGALASGTTITLYAQSTSSGYNGKSVGSFAYSANSNGVLQNVPSIDLSSYSPGVPIYIYAVINDGVNTPVYSALSKPVVPVPDLVGRVTDQFGNPIAGMRIFLDLNDDQNYDAPVIGASGAVTQPGDPSAITNAGGYYYFNDLEGYSSTDIGYTTFRVMAVMPSISFTPITPSNATNTFDLASYTTTTSSTSSITENFSVNRLASITGSLYSDLVQNGVYLSTDPALSGATVYLDTSGTGSYQSGDPTCVTGPSGTYGFYDLTPTSYSVGILTSSTVNNVTTNLYVVTQPSSGTYTIPIASDAQQLTGYTFGVISLATISGTVTSQSVQGSTTTPLAGATINLSTPNLSASVPNYSNFGSTSGLTLNNSSVSSSKSLTMLSSGQSAVSTSAWYQTGVPITGGFESSFQWSMSSSNGISGGFAFVVQNDGTSAVGSTAYGYGGLAKSLAVIFDASDNEILIETGGNTAASNAIASLSSAQLGFSLTSGSLYTGRITYLPAGGSGLGTLNVYLSGDSTGGLTPVLSASVNLSTILSLGTSNTALLGFTAGTSSTGLAASITSWSVTALTTQWSTSDSQGNYSFTGLMPQLTYTVSQVAPNGYIQATPSNTKGIYSQESTSTSPQVVSSVATGDFNGDGYLDVAYASSLTGTAFQISYAYGNGNGGFNAPVVVNLPLTVTAPKLAVPSNGSQAFNASIVAGHFGTTSRDEIAYIATMAKGGQVLVVYDVLNNNVVNQIELQPSISPTSVSTVSAGYAGTVNNVAVGDLNNDGYDDLAVSTFAGVYTIVSLQSLPLGTTWLVNPTTLAVALQRPTLESSSAVAYNAGVALADFNQDGYLDLASVGVQYVPNVTKSDGETIDSWTSMTVDTTIQLAYGSGNGVNYQAQSQISFQSYSSSNIDDYFSSTSSYPTYPIPFGLTAADVSGDSIPDLELNGYTSTLQPAVFLITQSAPGTFTASSTITIPNGKSFDVNGTPGPHNTVVPGSTLLPSQLIAIDLNGDGYLDIAAVDPNMGQLLLLQSLVAPLTSGQSQNLQVLAGGALPQFAQADFNLDGYPDLLCPASVNGSSQSAPVLILNGTINLGVISYTPSNGQALTGQNFNDIAFSTSTVSASAVSGSDEVSALGFSSRGEQIVGRVFVDRNRNGRYSANESSLSGLVLYLDRNGNGRYDPSIDKLTYANSDGYFAFSNLSAGQTYTVRIANLPGAFIAKPIVVTLPATEGNIQVERYIGVYERWSAPQPARTVDPLTPVVINLAPLSLRNALGIRPMYEFVGLVPQGMTIDPYSGQILWTPSANYAGSTVYVVVRIVDSEDRSPLQRQSMRLEIRVNPLTPTSAYVRDVFGALLGRLPTSAELKYWSSRLQSGTSRMTFVAGLAHTDEHYTLLTVDTYLKVLSRRPTEPEIAASLALFHSGGNSDQLIKRLLTSPSFIVAHKSYVSYVKAVNLILANRLLSATKIKKDASRLRRGLSRERYVSGIFNSRASTQYRVAQVTGSVLTGQSTSSLQKRLFRQTVRRRWNTDVLLEHLLASSAFANSSLTVPVPGIRLTDATASPQYNRLNHMEFALTGRDATRPELDSIQSQLFAGQSWRDVAELVYNGAAGFIDRVQTQYKNLLHRTATAGELFALSQTLPHGNQVDALMVRLLSGSEYRKGFATTAQYVSTVYRVLTGAGPDAGGLRDWTQKLDRGLAASRFVNAVNESRAGRVGQVTRNYTDLLLRDPTQLELDQWLGGPRKAALKDRAIALSIVDSQEFQAQQRSARLLPHN